MLIKKTVERLYGLENPPFDHFLQVIDFIDFEFTYTQLACVLH